MNCSARLDLRKINTTCIREKADDEVQIGVAEEMVKQGFMAEPKVEVTTLDNTKNQGLWSSVTWGINSKSFAKRARKNLGWEPTRGTIKDAIPEIVSSEAKRLGIEPQAS